MLDNNGILNNTRQPQYKAGDKFELKYSGFWSTWTINRVGNYLNNDERYEYFGEVVIDTLGRCVDNNKRFTEYEISNGMFGLKKR